MHYYDLEPILQELDDLNTQHDRLRKVTNTSSELQNFDKIAAHLRTVILDKIYSINFNFRQLRPKRSLFPKLGTVVKFITGNLDENDQTKYNQILNDIQTNGERLQRQAELQYTFNTEAVKRFDLVVQNIEHNEQVLATKISQVSEILEKGLLDHSLLSEPAYNQLIFLYNNLYNIVQEIENSLSFCHARTYHPSILRFEELQSILSNLTFLHQGQIPVETSNLSELQKLIDVSCKVVNNKIVFFLSFPVNYNTKFDLYYLLSIPTHTNLGFATILPKNKYLLKSGNIIKTMNNKCELGTSYQCFSKDVDHSNADNCETEILQTETPTGCQYTPLEITGNHIDFIPEINHYLIVFPELDVIKFDLVTGLEIKKLKGIFLLESVNGKLIYRDQELYFHQISTGKPFILNNIIVNITEDKVSNLKIKLSNIRLDDLKIHQLIPNQKPITILDDSHNHWKILNCLTFLVTLLLVLSLVLRKHIQKAIKYFRTKKVLIPPTSNNADNNHPEKVYPNFPGDAKL